jgi:hypothetical protein
VLLLTAAALGLLAGLLAGGSITNLQYVRFRWPLVLVGALLLKDAGVITPLGRLPFEHYLYLVMLVVLVFWTLWHYEQLPAIWLVSVGMALNALVVAANGGRMPVARDLADHGPPELLRRGELGQYVLAGPNTRLPWLSDWIGLPGPVGHFFPQAYSPGDLVAFVGMATVVFLAVLGGSYYTSARVPARPLPHKS